MKQDILSMNKDLLIGEMVKLGMPKFKGKQVFTWLHGRGAKSFDCMSDVSKQNRETLQDLFVIPHIDIEKKLVSDIDGTVKYLFRLSDGNMIESVVMRYKHGNSICISTQVGCKMGCDFCASAIAGFIRNLTTAEMLLQIYKASEDLGESIASVVLMGVGEPMDNYENVVSFLKILSSPDGRGMSLRHVSLSTSGIVDKIYSLAEEKFPLTLSISLHAPSDEIRDKIMPVNKKWPIDEIIKACRHYCKKTGRRISFEYIMIDDLNDSPNCANLLSSRLKGIISHVNLIPANPIKEKSYKTSRREHIDEFERILTENHITVTVRRKMGADINAACGQLRRDHKEGVDKI